VIDDSNSIMYVVQGWTNAIRGKSHVILYSLSFLPSSYVVSYAESKNNLHFDINQVLESLLPAYI
jgi:hypothetical protein